MTRNQLLDFTLDAEHEAHEPPEARGVPRDHVRMLVSHGDADPVDARFTDLGTVLGPGDLLVVNTSATIPAAFDGQLPNGAPIVVHLSGTLPGDVWLVEVRKPQRGSTVPLALDHPVDIPLLSGGTVHLLAPFADSERLWLAGLELGGPVVAYAYAHGRPIRYRHVERDWPLSAYETIFAREPGSAEMPSASRPFTQAVVTDLVTRGVLVTPLLLHTGVSSLEGGERPYPERYRVPRATAAAINAARAGARRVVAVGTTVVRAVATVTDELGVVHPGEGWTETVVTPDTPVSSVDGLVTGWHEPQSSHLMMLEAFASAGTLGRAYDAALALGYRWHEFGDSHLILREEPRVNDRQDTPARPAATLPAGRRAVLYAVRRRGEATAEQVAEQLAMTVSGARQHLSALARDGYVDVAEVPAEQPKRGRRALVYSVTDAADAVFPKAYGELTNELLGYVGDRDPGLIDDLFAQRRETRVANATARLERKRGLGAKVAELTRILDEDGYLASYEKVGSGVYRIVEHNCAIWAVAQRYGQACSSEIEFIRAVLPEAQVERVQHMIAGARRCAYEVRVAA